MIVLNEKTNDLIETEFRLGLTLTRMEAILERVIRKAARRYRFKIADDAARASNLPAEYIRKRSRLIPVRGKGKKKTIGGVSYLAFFIPVAALGATQEAAGVRAVRGLFYGGHFIANAKKFGGGGMRKFVFRRVGRERHPLREARVQVYQSLALALEKFTPDAEAFINLEIQNELARAAAKR